jgi:hypothetical protein
MFKGFKVFGLLMALMLSLVAVQSVAAQASTPTGSLSATDQALTNNAVLVTSVTASQDGWVVVHESNADGTVKVPDNIGKTAIKAGTTTNLSIPLDKQVADGAKLWPMLHIDLGQPGVYEFPGPDVPVAANGDIVMVPVVVHVAAAQPTAAPAAPTGSLAATDQALTNNAVLVTSVTASQDGWVVVHESNADGTVKVPDNIGKVAIKAGTTNNLSIPLDKQVADGAKLWPMLHIDVGQPGVYEFPGPDVPVAANGDIVMVPVVVHMAAVQPPVAPAAPTGSLAATDQLLVNNTVIVSSVTASQDGWVVVHESNADGTVKVPDNIGKTAIKAGTTTNLSIALDTQVANGAKLWPMLHIDVGQPGVYEFPGPDVPVAANGDIVMVPIIVNVTPSGVNPGMPTTGQNDLPLFGLVALLALGLLSLGWVARRRAGSTR